MPLRVSGFYKLTLKERLNYLKKFATLSDEEVKLLLSSGALRVELADRMIENVTGVTPIPLGIDTGFIVNDKEYLVPMATEQRFIISMTTGGAELTGATGGFKAKSTGSTMIGQIQLTKVKDFENARQDIPANKDKILREANTQSGTCQNDRFASQSIEVVKSLSFLKTVLRGSSLVPRI